MAETAVSPKYIPHIMVSVMISNALMTLENVAPTNMEKYFFLIIDKIYVSFHEILPADMSKHLIRPRQHSSFQDTAPLLWDA